MRKWIKEIGFVFTMDIGQDSARLRVLSRFPGDGPVGNNYSLFFANRDESKPLLHGHGNLSMMNLFTIPK